MREINILTVCGSGTVSSTMVGQRIKELLEENGYACKINEVNTGMVSNAVQTQKVDIIAHTCPVDPNTTNGIPCINAVGVLTGMDEETFVEAALKIIEGIKE